MARAAEKVEAARVVGCSGSEALAVETMVVGVGGGDGSGDEVSGTQSGAARGVVAMAARWEVAAMVAMLVAWAAAEAQVAAMAAVVEALAVETGWWRIHEIPYLGEVCRSIVDT